MKKIIALMFGLCVLLVTPVSANECGCSIVFSPVCGENNVTYLNACQMGCEGVTQKSVGECEAETLLVPIDDCHRGMSGEVCGSDQTTYEDICDLPEGVGMSYQGVCETPKNSLGYVEVPSFCTVRYNGCNKCQMNEGVMGGCTKMACEVKQRGTCAEFGFSYITDSQEATIREFVTARSLDTPKEDKARILDKVQSKIAEVQYTMAVSRFTEDSSEYRTFQFSLEVLWLIHSVL